ncbi:MAG: YitT family protein [Deferribacterales bacterium]
MRKNFSDFSMIILAGLLYAVAVKYFVLPSKVILTGSEGIATALSYYFESYSLFIILYLVFQMCLITFGFFKVSRAFALRTFTAVATVVTALAVYPEFQVAQPEPQNERIILVLFGGIIAGVAKAIAFKHRGSTGDEDILGAFFAMKYLKPVGFIGVIAGITSTVFGMLTDLIKNGQFESVANTLMYTSIYIFISTEVLNIFYKKFKLSMLSVMTRDHEQVGRAIKMASPHRTYTLLQGVGGHSGESFWMVRTIVTHEELPMVIKSIEETNSECFYFHHDLEGISPGYYIAPIG